MFPINYDSLYFGETFTLKMLFTDNIELGSLSVDNHNNFDHHSHSTEITKHSLGEFTEPINPFVFINDYDIPDEL